MPLGLNDDGLPLGVQVAAGRDRDHVAIAVALELERAFGGWVPPARRAPDPLLDRDLPVHALSLVVADRAVDLVAAGLQVDRQLRWRRARVVVTSSTPVPSISRLWTVPPSLVTSKVTVPAFTVGSAGLSANSVSLMSIDLAPRRSTAVDDGGRGLGRGTGR